MKRQGNRKIGTAILGVALIVAGVVLLGVQMSPAFASRLEPAPYQRKHIRACNDKVRPFDSYQDYMPHLVRLGYPIGDQLAQLKMDFDREVRSAISEARTGIRESHRALREALHEVRQGLRASLRSLSREQGEDTRRQAASPRRDESELTESSREAI